MKPEHISKLLSEDIAFNNGLLYEEKKTLPTRKLGKTGYDVGIISMGGQAGFDPPAKEVKKQSMDDCIETLERAYELGVNYFDTSPMYGESEDIYGVGLKSFRKKIFLATKTHKRDKSGSLRLLEKSLKRLKTDYLDLWQIHHIDTMEDVTKSTGKDGALQALIEMKEQKVVRNIGFTGHECPKLLVEMTKRYDFDTVLCAVNPADKHVDPSFIKTILPVANRKNMGIIGMKVFAQSYIFNSNGINTTWEPIIYTLSQPISTIIIGVDNKYQLEENVAIAKTFRKLTTDEMKAIEDKTKKYVKRAQFFHKKYGGYDSRYKLDEPHQI